MERLFQTYLGLLLLDTGLSLRERGGRDLLGGLGRLSLRRKDISECSNIAVFPEL